MSNVDLVRKEVQRLITVKQHELDDLYPDNYTAAMFMDDAEAAVRKAKIEMLKTSIYELKRIHNGLGHCV